MKKLSLEMLRLTSADVLERSQMKMITGGFGVQDVGQVSTNALLHVHVTVHKTGVIKDYVRRGQ
jgi:hypothetical protein